MSFPTNITRDHLIKAIEKIDQEGIPKGAQSSTYDVVFYEKRYPPKVVVSFANIFANGSELDRAGFKGGINTECFNLLEKYGFIIELKEDEDFFGTLIKFLIQAQTTELKTAAFPRTFQGLELKVSFGQGNVARVPWIAFLGDGQGVSNGIYPAYLYYKKEEILILTYGLSETVTPEFEWPLSSDIPKIKTYFQNEFTAKPDRYGESFVFSIYKITKTQSDFGLEPGKINQDINKLLQIYKSLPLDKSVKPQKQEIEINLGNVQISFNPDSFHQETELGNFTFSKKLITRFIAALCTKPFVILTGLAGSGKTKLAQAFAHWITEGDDQVCLAAVGADWTNRDPLLGYPNALEKGSYTRPDNGVLDLLIRAGKPENSDKPYFLILDEMNLSHVERYFADFLSAMESSASIALHGLGEHSNDSVPNKIALASNLFLIGTVNIDETTYMFSPKVLDRASVIEFRVTAEEMGNFLQQPVKADYKQFATGGANMAKDFVRLAKTPIEDFTGTQELRQVLLEFFQELKKVGAEFGYRSATEIYRFAGIVPKLDPVLTTEDIIDAAIMQKLLPKIHGSRRKIEPALRKLASLCLLDKPALEDALAKQDFHYGDQSKVRFPIALEKISRMYRGALQDGFTSFAEA